MPENTRQKHQTSRARVAFLSAACGALKSGEVLPERLTLLNWGENHTRKGLFIVNERTLACLASNQELMGRQRVKIDFEHASTEEKNKAAHPMKFAGECEPACSRENGLTGLNASWTEAGTEFVPEHYSDLSVAPIYDEKTREVIGVHSVAVCRHGAADCATIENSLAALNAGLVSLSNDLLQSPEKPAMNPEKALLVGILTALGITVPEEATAEQLTALAEEAKGKLPKPGECAPASSTQMAELSAQITKLTGQVATLSANAEKAEKVKPFEALLSAALDEGRIVALSADELMALGMDRAKQVIDAAPAGAVPMDQRTPRIARLSANPLNGGGVSQDELSAYADLGLEHPTKKQKTA